MKGIKARTRGVRSWGAAKAFGDRPRSACSIGSLHCVFAGTRSFFHSVRWYFRPVSTTMRILGIDPGLPHPPAFGVVESEGNRLR